MHCLKEDTGKWEAPWVTEQIILEIRRRQKLNRAKRNCADAEDKKKILNYTLDRKVQALISGEMHKYETKVATDIKQDKSRGKKLWDDINKLRGKTGRNEGIQHLYDINEQPIKISEMDVEIEQYWDSIHKKKHKNDIIDIWNEESTFLYNEFIENEYLKKNIAIYDNKNFPIVLREHFDSDIHIEEKITPMEYPEITQAELHNHLILEIATCSSLIFSFKWLLLICSSIESSCEIIWGVRKMIFLRIKTLRSFGNIDFLASLGHFNGTWIEHLEIKMFIATGRISSGETWSSSWIQFVNLSDCEKFSQSDLLKSNPLITKPTRVTDHFATLIYNIYRKCPLMVRLVY